MPRSYRLKRRAAKQAETRQRIVDATVALHRTLGPAQTTISAIAERAGVQRLTVYRHFPDERSLMAACSGQFDSENPPPAPGTWIAIEDGPVRFRRALSDMYEYYGQTEEMLRNVLRDAETDAVTREFTAPYYQYLEVAKEILAGGWDRRENTERRLCAAIGHAISFHTWHSLTREQGLSNDEAVELMLELAIAAVIDQDGIDPHRGR